MTRDEAIEKVIDAFSAWECEYDTGQDWSEEHEARDMAVEALATEAIPIEWIMQFVKKMNIHLSNKVGIVYMVEQWKTHHED